MSDLYVASGNGTRNGRYSNNGSKETHFEKWLLCDQDCHNKSSVASWDLSSREGPPQVRWNRGLYKRGEERVSFSFMGL